MQYSAPCSRAMQYSTPCSGEGISRVHPWVSHMMDAPLGAPIWGAQLDLPTLCRLAHGIQFEEVCSVAILAHAPACGVWLRGGLPRVGLCRP